MIFAPAAVFTHDNAMQQMAAGIAAIDAGQTSVSFSQTTQIDSSAVVCMLAWQKHAKQRGATLGFADMPTNLSNLIALYGVNEFL
jgi:phospholipid transport system transporter-binding protein